MTRDRNEDREHELNNEPSRRERPWGYDDPYAGRGRSLAGDYGSGDRGRGRFGERADYDNDEPRYMNYSEDRVVEVIRKMGDKQVRRIPVGGEKGILRGMISMSDIAVETEADRELAEALEDISKESSFWDRVFN